MRMQIVYGYEYRYEYRSVYRYEFGSVFRCVHMAWEYKYKYA